MSSASESLLFRLRPGIYTLAGPFKHLHRAASPCGGAPMHLSPRFQPMTFAVSLFLGLSLTTAVSRAADQYILFFDGLHYECAPDGAADPSPGTFLAIGDSYACVGEVIGVNDILLSQFAPQSNQYTVVITGGAVSSRAVNSLFLSVGMSSPITLRVFEDPLAGGTSADYAPNPPNALVPSSFADGRLVLEAQLTFYGLQWIPSEGQGVWSANTQLVGGDWLPLVNDEGFLVGGNIYEVATPSGYHARSQSQWANPAVDVRPTSWGRLKSLYR